VNWRTRLAVGFPNEDLNEASDLAMEYSLPEPWDEEDPFAETTLCLERQLYDSCGPGVREKAFEVVANLFDAKGLDDHEESEQTIECLAIHDVSDLVFSVSPRRIPQN